MQQNVLSLLSFTVLPSAHGFLAFDIVVTDILFVCRRSASPNKAATCIFLINPLHFIQYIFLCVNMMFAVFSDYCYLKASLYCFDVFALTGQTGKATVFDIYITLYNIDAVAPVKLDSNQAFNLLRKQMRIFGANKRYQSVIQGLLQRLWFLLNRIGRRWRYSGLQSFLTPAQWWQHPQFPLHGILWVFSPDKCVFKTKSVYRMELIFPFRDIKLWWCWLSPKECGNFFSLCLYCDLADGSPSSGVSDGMFRKPSEGQSLISYLSEQDFGSCADLEKVSQSSPQHSLQALQHCSEPSFSAFRRRTPISAFPSPSLLPLSWWSTTCGIRRRVRRKETATVRSSSSSRRFAWGGNRSDAAACCRPPPLSAVRPHLINVKWNHASLKASIRALLVLFLWYFLHSNSGSSPLHG